jgi:hypothetical protein
LLAFELALVIPDFGFGEKRKLIEVQVFDFCGIAVSGAQTTVQFLDGEFAHLHFAPPACRGIAMFLGSMAKSASATFKCGHSRRTSAINRSTAPIQYSGAFSECSCS